MTVWAVNFVTASLHQANLFSHVDALQEWFVQMTRANRVFVMRICLEVDSLLPIIDVESHGVPPDDIDEVFIRKHEKRSGNVRVVQFERDLCEALDLVNPFLSPPPPPPCRNVASIYNIAYC